MGKKQPKWAKEPKNGKRPKGLDRAEADNNSLPFRWRCNWIDLDGPWGFHLATHKDLWRQVIPRLHDFENNTWGEVYGKKDGSTHPMPVDNIAQEARDRLGALGKEEYDSLFQINVHGGCRIWGIRDRAYFYVMWFDPGHTVYVQKK